MTNLFNPENVGKTTPLLPQNSGIALSLREMEQQEQSILNHARLQAMKTTPEETAEIKQLSDKTGVPFNVVKADKQRAKTANNIAEMKELYKKAPCLSKILGNSTYMSLSVDDLENLSRIENSPFLIPIDMTRAAIAEPIDMFGTVIRTPYEWGAFQSRVLSKTSDIILKQLEKSGNKDSYLYDFYKGLNEGTHITKDLMNELAEETKNASQTLYGNLANFIRPPEERQGFLTNLSATVSQIASQVAMGAPGLAVMGAQSYINEQDIFREEGIYGETGADLAAITSAGLEALIERQTLARGLNKLDLGLGWKRAFIRMGINGLSEGGEEFVQSWTTDLINKAVGVDKSFKEMLLDSTSAGMYGALGSMVFTGLTAIPSNRRQRRFENVKNEQKTKGFLNNIRAYLKVLSSTKAGVSNIDALENGQADKVQNPSGLLSSIQEGTGEVLFQQPNMTVAALAELGDIATASTTNKRAPDVFTDIVNKITEKSNADTVFISAAEMQETFSENPGDLKAVLHQLNIDEATFKEAAEQGADVHVKTGQYVSALAQNEPIYETMNNIARLNENASSLKATQEIVKRTLDDIRHFKQTQQKTGDLTPREQEIKKIYDSFYQIGVGLKLGKEESDAVAKIWAARATVATQNSDITPSQWLERATGGRLVVRRNGRQAVLTAEQLQIGNIPNDIKNYIKALRRPVGNLKERGLTLLEFLASRGGLKNEHNELSIMDADKWHRERVGRRRLVTEQGMNLDDATLSAWENGYFGISDERPSPADLLDLIRDELSGSPIYSQKGKSFEKQQEIDNHEQNRVEIQNILDNYGLDLDKSPLDKIEQAINDYMDKQDSNKEAASYNYYQRAFVGSPDDYDTPILEKIGSGSGSQIHGWGLYYALNKNIAEKYREMTTWDKYAEQVLFFDEEKLLAEYEKQQKLAEIINDHVELDKLALLEDFLIHHKEIIDDTYYSKEVIKWYKTKIKKKVINRNQKKGQIHEVDVPDYLFLLDENLTFPKQSNYIKEKISQLPKKVLDNLNLKLVDGGDIYGELVNYVNSKAKYTLSEQQAQEKASKMLYKLGVKGITYNGTLDGRCFVIFNPKDVKVIRKFYQTIHGKVAFYENQVIIDLFKNANKSTLIHESAHVFLTDLLSAEDEISKKQVELLLKWFKIPDSHSITAQMQEKFARGFEKYLMEGVAPSLELKTVFARFRRWLIAIYKTLFGIDSASGQYINLNPEIRALFDSLIATDEQIRQVQELNALSEPLPKEYFKNEEEYHVYLSRLQEINDNTLDGVIARRFKALQKIRKGRYEQEFQKILNHEKTELAKTFPYNVRIALNKGNLKFYKDSAMSYGYKIPERWLSETGQIPEDIAAIYGLQSADALFEWLLHTPPLRQEAMKRAGQVMYERHEELLSQLSITEGVVRDLYNNARVRQLIEEEIRLYGNKNATPSQVIFEHAVQIATQNVIENSLLGDAQNVRKFAKAALKAAEDFNEVATKNIKHKMIEAKHRQALNASLVNAAYEAEDTISKIEKFFKDIKGREQLIGSKFYEQIKGLLSKHGVWENDFVPGQTFTAFSENLRENGEPTPIVASYLVEGASHNSYWRMTYAEFKDLYNAVKSIYTIGRNHRKMLTNAQKQEITDKALNLVNAIKENDTRSHIKQKDPLHIPTTFEKLKQRLEKLDAWLVKAEQVCLMLDGGKQGEFYNTFYKSLSDAETKKSIELLNIDKSLQKIFANYSAELFDRRFSIDGREMSFKQIFMLGLNWGNAGNREAVLNSTLGLTPVQTNFFLSKLTVQDWDVIQAVWDLMEKYKNRSFDLEEKLTGVRPKAIEPVPFTIAGKEYRGGYFPISFDPNLSTIAEDRAFRQAMEGQLMSVRFRPLTQKGFLKERKGTGGQAVQLNSLSLIKRHFDDLITDLNFREIKIDLVRLLKNQELSGVLKNRLSNPVYKELNKWVLDAGLRKTPLNLPDQLFDTLRMNGVRFAMAGNIKVMATQFSGLGATMAEVGATPTLRWLGAYLGSLTTKKNKEYGEFILNRSKFMRLRSREINRDLKEFYELNIGKSKAGILIDKKIEFLLKGIQKCDFIVSSISWRAGYEKAILEGKSEQDAIEYADSVVRLTQGAGRTIDQSRIQRENSTFKIITSFYSVFNVMYNRYRTAFVDIKENRGYVRLIREATYTLMVQSLIESLIRFFFDADKKKPFYKHALEQLFGQIFSLIPLGINVSYPVGKIISGENIGLVDITPLGFAPVKSGVEALSAFSRGKVTRGIKKSVETFGQATGFYSRSEMNFIQSLINQISETYFDPLEFINGRKMK